MKSQRIIKSSTLIAVPVLASAVLSLAGCTSLGPRTVPRDRADYSSAIGESWKRQTLLNIVKLRYLDAPVFVDMGQLVAGYSSETALNVGGQIGYPYSVNGNLLLLGGSTKYTDRPTVTYTPLTGNKFIRGLLTPLEPESVFSAIDSGWPADGVLFAAVASINGLKNQGSSIAGVSLPDPNFLRALELMRKIQLSGGVAMRIQPDAKKEQTSILTFRSKDISPETLADIKELRNLLRLDQEATEFKLVFGATAANDHEVAVLTRSMMQQMMTLASQIEVPAEDLARHRTPPGWESLAGAPDNLRLIQIHSSSTKPADTFVAVDYRGHWFWIDDDDLKSKRVLSLIMLMFAMADTGEKQGLPLITIPAQ